MAELNAEVSDGVQGNFSPEFLFPVAESNGDMIFDKAGR